MRKLLFTLLCVVTSGFGCGGEETQEFLGEEVGGVDQVTGQELFGSSYIYEPRAGRVAIGWSPHYCSATVACAGSDGLVLVSAAHCQNIGVGQSRSYSTGYGSGQAVLREKKFQESGSTIVYDYTIFVDESNDNYNLGVIPHAAGQQCPNDSTGILITDRNCDGGESTTAGWWEETNMAEKATIESNHTGTLISGYSGCKGVSGSYVGFPGSGWCGTLYGSGKYGKIPTSLNGWCDYVNAP